MFKMNSHPLYLAHHGIKGMKWGVRRFRDYSGKLTEAGKKRYADDNGGLNTKRVAVDTASAKSIVSGSRNIVSGVRQIANSSNNQPKNRYNKRKTLTQDEMDRMSDKELRDLVNRLNLEQQYSQLTSDNSRSIVGTGLDYADAILSIAGGAATIAGAYILIRGKL